MSFEVHQPNLDNMQQYLNNEKSRNKDFSDGPKWYSIPQGMSSVRILPPWDATGRVALPVFMHPIEYQGEGMKFKKYNWTCTEKTLGKSCQICEGLHRLSEAGVDISKYEANRRQFYVNAIVMFDPAYNADLQRGKRPEDCSGVATGTHVLLKLPKTIYDWIISQITNPMIGDITSLTNGIDVYITKEGTGLSTKYTPTLSPNGRTPVPKEYLDKIDNLYNLDDIFGSGFDTEQINQMVNSLNTSASAVNSHMAGTVTQMAGYAPASQPPAYANPAPSPYGGMQGAPVQNPYQTSVVPPAPPVMNPYQNQVANSQKQNSNLPFNTNNVPDNNVKNTSPVMTSSGPSMSNKPRCFGQYDPSQVNCVVCPEEINCMQSKRG